MKKYSFYYSVILIIILLLVSTLLLESEVASRITTIITVSTATIGAVALFVQYKRDRDVNQANFILEYAKYLYSLNGVEELIMQLDEYRLGNKDVTKDISYQAVINYLLWCEELAVLIKKNVVDIETIDNIFAYFFFLITNNKYIQERELISQAEFYKGTYHLHKIWTEYKIRTGQKIINPDESLSLVKEYEEHVKKGSYTAK